MTLRSTFDQICYNDMGGDEPRDETYLGDGLYASWDGFQICLRAPRAGGDHFVCLDGYVLLALAAYLRHVRGAGL